MTETEREKFWIRYVRSLLSQYHRTRYFRGIKMQLLVCPGATDARYIRSKDIPALGFSPLTHTPMLLHAHDEYLHADVLEQGIEIVRKVLEAVANL